MEFTFTYFWAIKLVVLSTIAFFGYKSAYQHKFRSTLWNVLFGIMVLLGLFNPIKLQPTTDNVTRYQNVLIEQHKVLPPMVRDNTFSDNSESVQHITQEDMK